MNPAIVVLAYNRPEALRRLLQSLTAANYPAGIEVPLIISIDRGEGSGWAGSVSEAEGFDWPFGPKTVLQREEHLGVVRHFREAGHLTQTFEGVILLEDDLAVAPPFYDFASRVLQAYGGDDRIAGCCLYGLWFNGFTHEPFQPLEDGSDAFFLQLPYTQGLCFNKRQWQDFESWSETGRVREMPRLHAVFLRFGRDEWFPELAAYLAESDRFFCFPRVSLTVGWGDPGAHFSKSTSWLQTTIPVGARQYRLKSFDDAIAVYDGFYELLPDRLRSIAHKLASEVFDLDLNATKQRANLVSDQVLTTRPVRNAISQFGLDMHPPELNVAWQVQGEGIALAKQEDVHWDRWAEAETRRRLHAYFWRRHRPSRRRVVRFVVARIVQSLRRYTGKWTRS